LFLKILKLSLLALVECFLCHREIPITKTERVKAIDEMRIVQSR
jgi:hypothetical protein